jgi:hypothetical protein
MGNCKSCPAQQPCPAQKACECPSCGQCEVCKTCAPEKTCAQCSPEPAGDVNGVWKIDPLEYRAAVVAKHPALADRIPPDEFILKVIEKNGMEIPSLHVKQITPTLLRVHSNVPLGSPILAGEKSPYVYFEIELQENGDFTAKKGFAGTFMVLRFNKELNQLALDVDVIDSRLPGLPAEARRVEKLPPPLIFNRVETFSLDMVKEYQNESWFYPLIAFLVLIVLVLLFGRGKKSMVSPVVEVI